MNDKNQKELSFHEELLNLSKNSFIDAGDLDNSLKAICEATAKALKVARASIWFYSDSQSSIICKNLFESASGSHSAGIELMAKDFPAYFNYLLEERTLPASDAHTDPATKEFSEVYLKPLNIFSMLDAPIRVNGKMIGVVCCEQTATKREWDYSEQNFVGNITDVIARAVQAKERSNAQEKLAQINAQLESIIQEKTRLLEEQRARSEFSSKMATLGEMAGSVAHEINNPLAVIISSLGYVKKLEQKGTLKMETMKEVFNDIEVTTQRIGKIVKGLRFFARDASLDELTNVAIEQIIEDTISLCHEKFNSSGFRIEFTPSSTPTIIRCQAVNISQAILNLLSNSFDAISELEEKWIKIETRKNDQMVSVRITDSGPGIPKENWEKIMLPFFTTKPIGKGTGLGLAIVKGIVEQHKGKFSLDESAKNTTFVIELPVASPK